MIIFVHFHQHEDGTLLWSQTEQGLVLGSYFWGYIITQVPGGRVAEMYGGKWVFFGAVAVNIFGTLLSPVTAQAGYYYLIIMRILMGLCKKDFLTFFNWSLYYKTLLI
jgi:MFS family permease